ncbi:MAG: homoserine O-acetyltransferase [Candidatus Aminicenantes bacterium]|nr:homoserine O-acetyltransferase [Candidatus Aminicenantes bacterium]NIM80871.1 homoserine O-acetyltransferase [Candidatus Aminicenantes bacterium]NIN20255.1 homoserine O-acetyltransferase [Candidatus Aminicenantes bacterium]NIN44034.1 homoserine O-acetyltransferase [Candidatus Aminicenantes bacterium]NIN86844.1 homoserine O-acetyltransferase [Candidatus Aminicenantes bacterium]
MRQEKIKTGSVGLVETRYFTFGNTEGDALVLESGQRLAPVIQAYETYGELNRDKSNAILVEHTLTSDAHAAGYHEGDIHPGWWDDMIGPGKAFDTDKYFVICSNVIGGCKGSTGPSSINPGTGKPYGLDFPVITVKDMVEAQKRLVDYLGIKRLLSVAGGSMGGMLALQWAADYPEMVDSAILIATAWKQSPQQLAFAEVGRQAIMKDPNWNNGNYYNGPRPENGLSVARMIGHITYMSETSMEDKFSRKLKNNDYSFSFNVDFEVESYLNYNGNVFVKRFDANSYLYITRALNYFDVSGEKLIPPGRTIDIRFLVISFLSDWLYPSWQSKEIVRFLMSRQQDTTYCEIKSTYGHDAFLLEFEEETRLIKHFLKKVVDEPG